MNSAASFCWKGSYVIGSSEQTATAPSGRRRGAAVTQVGKRALELGEDGRALAGRGRRREQPVAEGGHHEELLQRRVHVARRALVDQTGVRRAQLAARSDAPLGVRVAHVRALEARE